MKHLELFSGIGGFRQALNLIEKDWGVHQETIGFSEIEPNAVKTYKAAFETEGETELGDIVAFNSEQGNIRRLPTFQLLTGGFPCQAFSMMGKQLGFEDMRGNVFFQILEILKVKRPRYILLENVRNLISHNKGETFRYIIASIRNAGYPYIYYDVFNTEDFCLAQKRNRVFIFATTKKIDNIDFNHKTIRSLFNKNKDKSSVEKQNTTHDVLEKKVEEKYYLSDIIKPTILADGSSNYHSKSTINPLIARPLTATMVKMHRACQDNYFSDGYINSSSPLDYVKIPFTKEELAHQRIRKLTPREAFLLQGFSEDYFNKIKNTGVSNGQLYRQAGNSVSVNTVYAILYYLFVSLKLR